MPGSNPGFADKQTQVWQTINRPGPLDALHNRQRCCCHVAHALSGKAARALHTTITRDTVGKMVKWPLVKPADFGQSILGSNSRDTIISLRAIFLPPCRATRVLSWRNNTCNITCNPDRGYGATHTSSHVSWSRHMQHDAEMDHTALPLDACVVASALLAHATIVRE